jgi:ornithine cyclodeaminase/alanine dehydrogenase-like protein (mu-crystallin family)
VTADKQYATILTDNMVGSGVHINAVGGDCPGKTELHRDILHAFRHLRRISRRRRASKARYSSCLRIIR